jgi:hypothetical protein
VSPASDVKAGSHLAALPLPPLLRALARTPRCPCPHSRPQADKSTALSATPIKSVVLSRQLFGFLTRRSAHPTAPAEWERNLCCDVYIIPSPGAVPELCYRTQIGTTSEHNGNVIKGKMILAKHFGTSSMLATMMLNADPDLMAKFEEEAGLVRINPAEPAFKGSASAPLGAKLFGGCVPIFVGGEIAGFIGTSGEADVVDHEATNEGCRRFLLAQPKL